jgi:methyl-accepting chemotaxis protein
MGSGFDYVLDHMDIAVKLGAAAIFFFSLHLWILWSKKIRSIQADISNLNIDKDDSDASPRERISALRNVCKTIEIRNLLNETVDGFIELDSDYGLKTYSLRSYNDIWNIRSTLYNRINLPLFESMPNLLIGFGLMCTFIFLSLAIYSATAGLATGGADPQKALEHLLSSAAGKFVTSIAGLLCSLIWSWAAKSLFQRVEQSIGQLIADLKSIASDNASEVAIATQISLFKEILHQEREQVGQLKRFETDLAVAIAKATDSALSPALNKLASDMSAAIKGLSDRMSSINEDALSKMLKEFGNNLQKATTSEMELLKQTLAGLATSLDNSGRKISQGFQEAGEKTVQEIERAGTAIADSFGKGSENLKDAAKALEDAMLTAKGTINDFEEVVSESVIAGKTGADRIRQLTGDLENIIEKLVPAVSGVRDVVESIEQSVGNIQSASESLEDTIEAQGELVQSLKTFVPEFKNSLTASFDQIRTTAKEVESALRLGCTSLQEAGTTVDSLNSGVSAYTARVAELHSNLDREMEKAIGKLGGAISSLEETLDEFAETINEKR